MYKTLVSFSILNYFSAEGKKNVKKKAEEQSLSFQEPALINSAHLCVFHFVPAQLMVYRSENLLQCYIQYKVNNFFCLFWKYVAKKNFPFSCHLLYTLFNWLGFRHHLRSLLSHCFQSPDVILGHILLIVWRLWSGPLSNALAVEHPSQVQFSQRE